jgi:hypothetical protein
MSAAIMVFFTASACIGATVNMPQTGQTTCWRFYNSYPLYREVPCEGTGQDGDSQAGLAWPSPRFTQNTDTTLTDNLTGLVWAQNGNLMPSRDPGWDDTPTIDDGAVRWTRALDYVAKLNAENYLGHNDWRLPNLNELETLVNSEAADSTVWLNDNGFVNVQIGYWSSTTYVKYAYMAWVMIFNMGKVSQSDKREEHRHVWPVRAGGEGHPASVWKTGQEKCYDDWATEVPCAGRGHDGDTQAGIAWPSPRFTDNGDHTVTDNLTGLMWANKEGPTGPAICRPANTRLWQGALDFVACMNTYHYLAYTDWRLPNRKELRSLMDYSKGPGIILPSGHPFVNVAAGFWDFYWTSTTCPYQESSAWIIYMASGGMSDWSKRGSSVRYVWPVRAGEAADLVSDTGDAPLIACKEQTVTVTDVTQNSGGNTAGPSTTKLFFSTNATYDADDTYLGSREASSLAAGASDSGSTDVNIPPAIGVGTYYIITRADANGAVYEANETNNDNSRSIHIGPDLVVSDLSVNACIKPRFSGVVKVTIENRGGCPAGRSVIKFYASRNGILDSSDIYLGYTKPVPPLAAGASATRKISETIPPDIPAGAYYIIAEADASNSVREFDERNNAKSKHVTISRCP